MDREDLRDKVKRDNPELKGFTDAQINTELNESQLEIVSLTDCLPQEANFNITSGTETYALSSVASDFLKVDREGGLQIKTLDSNADFDRMDYRTMEELDELYPGWRNHASGTPHSYFVRGANIHIYPKSDTAITNGGRLYYIEKLDSMDADSTEPFNGRSYLFQFHKVICHHTAMTLLTAVRKYQDAAAIEQLFRSEIVEMINFVKGHSLDDYTPNFKFGLRARQGAGRGVSRFS